MTTTRRLRNMLAAATAMATLVAAAPAQRGGFGGGGNGGGGGSFGRSMMQRFQQNSGNGSGRRSSGRNYDSSQFQNQKPFDSSGQWSDQVKSQFERGSQGGKSKGSNSPGSNSKNGSGKLPDLSKLGDKMQGGRGQGDRGPGQGKLEQQFKDLSGRFKNGAENGNRSRNIDSILDRVGGNGAGGGSTLGDALRGNLGSDRHRDSFQSRLKNGSFDKMFSGELTKRVNWNEQLKFAGQGDVARRLDLKSQLLQQGGWTNSKFKGQLGSGYVNQCSKVAYCGPGWYPNQCYYPKWGGWVSWCWNYSCNPYWDPRPWYCRPICYRPCVDWVYCDYPVWDPLPVTSCGTWIDVAAATSGAPDLQLQAVRFVDPGHPERNEGPRFRVWVHNASTAPITEPFNVMLLAANSDKLEKDLPQAGVTVSSMKADEVQALDIRLPVEANLLGPEKDDQATPFSTLHVVVDSHQDVEESSEKNNGAALARTEIDPIDPYVLSSDVEDQEVADGSTVILAGEGLGPEPGQVVVQLRSPGDESDAGKVEVEAEITGWCDQGVQVTLPPLPVAIDTHADVVVIRGDGAMANPLSMKIVPQQAAATMDAPRVALR